MQSAKCARKDLQASQDNPVGTFSEKIVLTGARDRVVKKLYIRANSAQELMDQLRNCRASEKAMAPS